MNISFYHVVICLVATTFCFWTFVYLLTCWISEIYYCDWFTVKSSRSIKAYILARKISKSSPIIYKMSLEGSKSALKYVFFTIDFDEDIETKADDSFDYQCLINTGGKLEVSNCFISNSFLCNDQRNSSIAQGPRATAVDRCVSSKQSLYTKSLHRNITSWLSPFRMFSSTTRHDNKKCVALSKDGKGQSRNLYQYRDCSEKLLYICRSRDSNLSTAYDSTTTTVHLTAASSSIDDVTSAVLITNRTGPTVITVHPVISVNIVLFVLCLCVGALFMLRKFKIMEIRRYLTSTVREGHATFRADFQNVTANYLEAWQQRNDLAEE